MAADIESPQPKRSSPILPLLALATLLSGSGVVAHRLGGLMKRMDEAEHARLQQANDLREHLEGVRSELTGFRGELEGAISDRTEDLSQRLEDTEQGLDRIGAAIEAQSSSLIELEQAQASFEPGLERMLRDRDERLTRQYEALNALAASAKRVAEQSQGEVTRLDQRLSTPPDLVGMWRELVGPVVQLAGETSVGSGVMLPCSPAPDEGGYRSYLITAWHVVRDIQGDPPDLKLPVPVQIYHEDGTTRQETARLLQHDPKLDAALLEVITPDPLEFGARLATPERLAQARIFDRVVAVGCPLGNDPIPTRGEIATCNHQVDGECYWMINAPTYIGNSGGGIFDSESHELLGIFSKIYTHGSLRPTIVPHMGLVTPLPRIYEWLERVGYGQLIPSGSGRPVASSK